jgi:hypothetical protein
MHDAGKIIAGLVIFLAIATSPMLYQWTKGAVPGPPELKISPESEQCVQPTQFMRSLHMDLLDDWRDEAVRDGDRTYVAFDGKVYEKSIAGTCLSSCHSSKDEFCDRCHEYVGAEPYCWDCHAKAGTHTVMGDDGEAFTRVAGVGAPVGGRR